MAISQAQLSRMLYIDFCSVYTDWSREDLNTMSDAQLAELATDVLITKMDEDD
jgi:hypothetical protein